MVVTISSTGACDNFTEVRGGFAIRLLLLGSLTWQPSSSLTMVFYRSRWFVFSKRRENDSLIKFLMILRHCSAIGGTAMVQRCDGFFHRFYCHSCHRSVQVKLNLSRSVLQQTRFGNFGYVVLKIK